MNHQIETDDLFKASYYLCCGGVLKDVTILSHRKVCFIIEGENLEEAERLFYLGQASIDPLKLKERLNQLRSLLNRKLNETEPKGGKRYDHRNRYSKRVQPRMA